MFDTLKHIFKWVLVLIVTILLLFPACIIAIPFKYIAFKIFNFWGKLALYIFNIKVEIIDKNQNSYTKPPYLFLNLSQTSLCETFVLSAYAPAFFVTISNIEYALIPFVGWIQKLMGGIVIIRQRKQQAKQGIEKAKTILRKKISIGMSIEGKRSPDGCLQPYKKGPVVLALDKSTPIVPLIIIGAKESMPYGAWTIKTGKITLIFEEIIDTQSYSIQERDLLIHKLRSIAEKYVV